MTQTFFLVPKFSYLQMNFRKAVCIQDRVSFNFICALSRIVSLTNQCFYRQGLLFICKSIITYIISYAIQRKTCFCFHYCSERRGFAHFPGTLDKENFSDLFFSCFLPSGIISALSLSLFLFFRIRKIYWVLLCLRFLVLFDSNEQIHIIAHCSYYSLGSKESRQLKDYNIFFIAIFSFMFTEVCKLEKVIVSDLFGVILTFIASVIIPALSYITWVSLFRVNFVFILAFPFIALSEVSVVDK